MKLGTILKLSFIISIIITFIGASLKIMHLEGAEALLIIGLLSTLVFIATAIYEVITSKQIDNFEKAMWTFAFIFLSGITGIIYFLVGRRRIATNYKAAKEY